MSDKLLTKEIAEQLVQQADQELCLISQLLYNAKIRDGTEFDEIENDAAQVISDYCVNINHSLRLDIKFITTEAAKHLSKIHELGLKLEVITDDAAQHLSEVHELYLEELTEVSDAALEFLSETHDISLGLESISESQAEIFSRSKKCKNLGVFCKEISEVAAEYLSLFQGDSLYLPIETISAPAAKSLSKFKGKINGMDPKEFVKSLK